MNTHTQESYWESERFDLWLSLLIGLLTAISLSHIASGIFVALMVHGLLRYVGAREEQSEFQHNEEMVRLPVQAL
jgi:hypothetical protein